MQKDFNKIQEQGYYQPGNQMIYSSQQLQQLTPNLSSQQASLMQGPMQTQGRPIYSTGAEQPIRPPGRMPQYGTTSYMNNTGYSNPGQPTEVTSGYPGQYQIAQQPTGFMPNGMPPFQNYGNINYTQRSYTQPVYVVQPTAYNTSNVVHVPMQTNQSHPIQNSPRQMFPPQMGNVHSNPAPIMMSPSDQPAQQQKKRPTIKLTDPNTGKDLTSEILKKKEKVTNAVPAPTPDQNLKAKTAALFAAQVAEKIAGTTQQPELDAETKKTDSELLGEEKTENDIQNDGIDMVPTHTPQVDSNLDVVQSDTKEVKQEETINPTQADKVSEVTSTPDMVENTSEEKTDVKVDPKIDCVAGSSAKDSITSELLASEDAVIDIAHISDLDTILRDVPASTEDESQKVEELINSIEDMKMNNSDTKSVENLMEDLPEKMDVLDTNASDDQTISEAVPTVKDSVICSNEVSEPELPVSQDVVKEEIIEVVPVVPTETLPDTIPVQPDTRESPEERTPEIVSESPDTSGASTEAPETPVAPVENIPSSEIHSGTNLEQDMNEPYAKEDVVKNEKIVNKNEKNKDDKLIKKEESSKPVEVSKSDNKEATLKKETEIIDKDKESRKKKEQVKTKENIKKESITKEDASKRFEPSFRTEESIKNTESKNIKTKEPVKSVELKTVETVKKVDLPKKSDSSKKDETVINGHDDSVKFTTPVNQVTKKKKGKNRFKEIDEKSSVNNDMLSAFVDAPAEITPDVVPEPVKAIEKPPEETTWEDKENSIEKEDIRGEDAEEEVVMPKKVETKILKSEDSLNDEKHQYDREFLLKFQFAPICTSKPANLPNIDIVLDEAHAPTKALIPGQRIAASNDFMPTFMRQSSGGRNSATGGRRDNRDNRKGGSQGGGGQQRQPKILQAPQFEKIELKKAENAWVRPSEQTREMGDEEKALFEVNRAVCSILNKLTPQKFKPLVNQMLALKINNAAKLENAIASIFEKAISEPGFSVAYANMCRVLTDQFNEVPVSNEPGAPVVRFRKILLNKCQTEFEKETSDEKKLAEDRNKTFDTEEERKNWIAELDYRERTNRRRMLGNIRFIGELYKLKMISEPIMHDCILKLLRAEKQDSLEDQLECLCKLLTTIGKDLDHVKAKPRMDQYFDQMEKVIEKRKISSRIKFALKDVIDLRGCNWVPRRDDANPKTIDQIHREAQQKEKESEQARQQDKLQRKLEPKGGGRGGRDSPSVRGAPGGGSGGTSDGWSTVSSANKSRQMPTAPLDPNKFRGIIKKTDTSEISLGPGGRAGAWSKGASGGVSSRSGSGSNTPTGEIDQGRNRYDLLTDSAVAPGSLDGKRGSGGRSGMTPRKGMSGGHGSQQGNRRDRDEQNAALRAVRDMTGHHRNQSPGRGSRNQSPAPPFERDTSSPRGQTPVVSPNPTVTQDKMRKVTKSTVEEYLSCKDDKEAMLCLTELQSPGLHNIFVEEAVMIVIEKKPEHRRIVGALIHRMLKESLLNASQVCQGLTAIVDLAPDFAVDIPHIYKYVGEILSPIVYDGTLPLNKVKDTLEPLIQKNKAGIVMAEALSGAVQIAGKEELITTLWSNSKVTWEALLASDENVQQFLKDKKMEFTLKTSHPSSHSQSSNLSHATQIQEEMLRIINDSQRHENNNDNADLISYIEQNISPSEKKTSSFIQVLTTAVCSSSINKDSNCECNKELLSKRKNVLLKYIDRSKDLELQALFAIQLLVHELKQPRGLLRDLFDVLYEGDIITEDAFFNWETSKESPLGKGHALSSVKDFLSWLKKADEESNDEESSTSPTNVA